MKSFFVSIMFVLVTGSFATVALAAPTVEVRVGPGDSGDPLSDPLCDLRDVGDVPAPDPQTVLVRLPPSETVAQFYGSCGDITFTSPNLNLDCDPELGSCPTVTAQQSGVTDQLILSNTVITNNSDSSFHTITITYTGAFPNIDPNLDRFYGMSASGNFFRPPFDLASGDSFKMTSYVTYKKSSGLVTEQIGGSIGSGVTLQYPSSGSLSDFGSVSLNDFTPQDPAQVIEKVNCNLLKPTNQKCSTSYGEEIKTVLTVVLGPGDSISLLGSAHNPVTKNTNDLETILSSFTALADVKPGDSDNFVGPSDQGSLEVALFGGNGGQSCYTATTGKKRGTQQQVCINIPEFDVTKVNLKSLVFGPNCPAGYNPLEPAKGLPGCSATKATSPSPKFQDVNGDSVMDVRLYFDNPKIGWDLGCANVSGTLVGLLTDNTLFTATSSIHCQPPK